MLLSKVIQILKDQRGILEASTKVKYINSLLKDAILGNAYYKSVYK